MANALLLGEVMYCYPADYLKALGIPVLRWPGGCFVHEFGGVRMRLRPVRCGRRSEVKETVILDLHGGRCLV